MLSILVFLHVLICLLMVLAILIQQGKGASMGMLGGASQAWFGPTGSKTFLMKLTVGLAVAFLVTSVLITLVSTRRPMAVGPAAPAPTAPASPPPGNPPAR